MLPTSGSTFIGHLFFWPLYLKRVALLYLTLIHSWKLECLDSFCSSTSALFGCCICGPARLARKAFQFSLLLAVLSRYFAFAWVIPFPHVLATVGHKVSNYWKCGILLAAEEVVRAGVWAMHRERKHVSPVSPFIDWSASVGLRLVVGVVLSALLLLSFCSLTNLYDRVINRSPTVTESQCHLLDSLTTVT